MKYGVYNGSLVEIDGDTIIEFGERQYVKGVIEITNIPEGEIQELLELMKDIKIRMEKLELQYKGKMEALRHHWTDARAKEMEIINKVLKDIKIECEGRYDDDL